ncbi:MAG: pyrimidine-nucleoside phosphorylase [Spirochaetaceae bacterium]|nr:pyrimidine-nucleoside phosphorylase [Spirochaetaceae bacterium]
MLITDLIERKKQGESLSCEEINFFIKGYVEGIIPDYQATALLMAIWFKGMDSRETTDLTLSMTHSGDVIDLSEIPGIKVDKHSTGGVSDGTTLIVAPLVAACGGKVAKMSGRGLGHTGGTIDKLESIPGFCVNIGMKRFIEIVSETGLSLIGQDKELVPADKKLYALRDVTGTVDNISLIASSVMSKKIASGSNAIVLDIKTGNGAFMKKIGDSVRLAEVMVEIGKLAGRKTIGIVTDMNQPLGFSVGNALEVREAIEVLQGKHESHLKQVAFTLASRMLMISDICATESEAFEKLEDAIASGKALFKLAKMIEMQNGNPDVVSDISLLPQAAKKIGVKSDKKGYITAIETKNVGIAAMMLGAGREKKEDTVDPAVGIWLNKRHGDFVKAGEELAIFYVNETKNLDDSISVFKSAYKIGDKEPDELPLIYTVIEE